MKKLTAGIFATLLAVVSVGAAHAEIASKGYVDQQVGTKADAATVSSLQGTVSGHTSQIGTINDTIGGYGDIVTHDASEFATSAQGAKADTAVQPADITNVERTANKTTTLSGTSTDAQYPSAKAVWDTIQAETEGIASSGALDALGTRVTTAEGEIDTLQTQMTGKANTADLGDLATLDAVGSAQITDGAVATADIANKAVTEAKLSDDIVASLGKADSALQQGDLDDYVTETEANAAYAVKTLENQVGTVSKENMGTTTATTVVAGVKEAIDAAKAADTKAGSAASAASAAQGAAKAAQADVDALETTVSGQGTRLTAAEGDIDDLEAAVNNAESGLAATNDIADSALSTAQSAQTTANAALPKATYDNQVGTVTAGNMGTSASTVVTAIKEVADEASAAQSTATAAQKTANAAIPAPTAACAEPDNKCVLVSAGAGNYSWEVIARDGEGE